MEIKETIEQLRNMEEVNRKNKDKYENLIRENMDDFRGRYFRQNKNFLLSVPCLNVIHIPVTKGFDLKLQYIYSVWSGGKDSYFKIDNKRSFKYETFDLHELSELQEITKQQYQELRKKIIKKAQAQELEKAKEDYDKIKKNIRGLK